MKAACAKIILDGDIEAFAKGLPGIDGSGKVARLAKLGAELAFTDKLRGDQLADLAKLDRDLLAHCNPMIEEQRQRFDDYIRDVTSILTREPTEG